MPSAPFASLLRPDLAELYAYTPTAGAYAIRLDANEAPPLLSEEARARVDRAGLPGDYCRYPDAQSVELRAAIAARCDARPEEVLVGTGTDEIIALLLTALDRPRTHAPATTIVTTSPTFVMYRISARARGMKVIEVPLDASWDLAVDPMRRAIELTRPNIVFVASPNNPTGTSMSADRLEAVIEAALDAFVVVDEAYVDYAPRSQISLLRRYGHVGVLRTLSKIGFAALRVGWLVGPEELVREVDKARQPYNVPVSSQRAGAFVLSELGAEIDRMRGIVVAERERLARSLADLGFDVPASHANFLWVGTRRPAEEVHAALAERGILVKSFHAAGGRLAHRLRITVGLPAENDRLLAEIAPCA